MLIFNILDLFHNFVLQTKEIEYENYFEHPSKRAGQIHYSQ